MGGKLPETHWYDDRDGSRVTHDHHSPVTVHWQGSQQIEKTSHTNISSVVESDVSGNFVCNVAESDSVGIVYTLSVALQVV